MKGKQQKRGSENVASEGSSRKLDTFDLAKKAAKGVQERELEKQQQRFRALQHLLCPYSPLSRHPLADTL